MNWIEKYILLRSLNYIRVSHRDAVAYNYIIPIIFSILLIAPICFLVPENNIYGVGGILSEFSSLLVILAPFYIVALAAVATFDGSPSFNEVMEGIKPPVLKVLDRGQEKIMPLTMRHFLSLMFGYCSLLSLVLFLANVLVRYIAQNTNITDWIYAEYLGLSFFALYIFFLMQLITTTLLGLYFLSDKLHRS